MKTLGKIAIAIIVIAFAINEANAQRRGRLTTPKQDRPHLTVERPNVKVAPIGRRDANGRGFFAEQRFRIRTGIYNAPIRNGYYIYNYNRPTRVISLRNQIRPAYFSGYRTNRLANQILIDELNEQLYEGIRARKLYKYVNKPSKRNKRKLVKWNILTGRDANEDIN